MWLVSCGSLAYITDQTLLLQEATLNVKMLKTTYKTSVPTSQLSEGWTEHKAPTGNISYEAPLKRYKAYGCA